MVVSHGVGVDLSSFQGRPDWQRVKRAGIGFAYAKATQGTSYANPTYDYDREGAVQHGLAFGGYHFAEATRSSGAAEAGWFLQHLRPQPWHLLPVLDLEETGSEGVPGSTLERFALAFAARVCRKLELGRMVLYTDRNMLEHRGLNTPAMRARFLLWLADLSAQPHSPPGWRTVLWQNNWHRTVPGIVGEVDGDVALVELKSLTIDAERKRAAA